jgi:murein L,D-transpeptidase YcbB/YkuD
VSLPARIVRQLAFVALCAAAACGRQAEPRYVPQEVVEVLGVTADELSAAIRLRLDSAPPPSWITPDRWARARRLYTLFGDAPLWLEPEGAKERARALLAALDAAPEHGLLTDGYPIDSIRHVVENPRLAGTTTGATAAMIAGADVLLTAAYVGYASDMLTGQVDPSTLSQSWHIRPTMAVVDSALAAALDDTSMATGLGAMAPQDAEYAVLRASYARYRQIADSGGWREIRRGVSSEELAERLRVEGFVVDSADMIAPDSLTVPPGVIGALKRFQERHGLEADGLLGRMTFAALNVPAAERARQIASNMERYRWLPRSLGSRYVYVNVPSFRLDAYDSGQRVLTMKVVVGSEYQGRATPVFSDSMESVVFRPYWNVTPTITKNEILPKVAKDPGYLARNHMEYYRSGGGRAIRQLPGPWNALGDVKFLFPNSYNIYMHDTNERASFGRAVRSGSHGCVRLERPAALAELVLGWSADSVKQAMSSGPPNASVKLATKIPVYIVYFTTYARDGQLHFSDDLYRRDELLKARLSGIPLADVPPAARTSTR